jgi:hypothetical protein
MAFVNDSKNFVAANVSATGNKPSGLATDDVMIAYVMSSSASATLDTPASGWTLVHSLETPGDFSLWVYRKLAAAGDPSSWNWTFSVAVDSCVYIAGYTGRDTSAPINASNAADTGVTPVAASYTTPSITPSVDSCDIVCFWMLDASSTGRTWGPDGTLTTRETTTGDASALQFCAADEVQATAAAISRTSTFSGTDQEMAAVIIALAPSVSTPPQTLRPDADLATTGWSTAPLWSKIDESTAGGDTITGVAS